MDFDDVLEELGEFGAYQITTYILICLPVFFSAANSLSYVFTAGSSTYRCFVPGCDNDTSPVFSEPWVQQVIPSSTPGDSYTPSQCHMYTPLVNATDIDSCPLGQFSKNNVTCDSWVFDDGDWTIVGEWNITCPDKYWMLSLVGTVHFAGILMGSSVFGFLADKWGRNRVFVFCILLMSVTGIAQAVCNDYITFQVFVFINALGTSGVFPLAFILGVELVGRRKREMSGIVLNYFYAVGEASVALVAYLTHEWRSIQLFVSAPCLVFIIYFWLVPESVRWLMAKSKTERASDIIKKAAKMNKVTLSERLLATFEEDATKRDQPSDGKKTEAKQISETILEIIKCRKLLLRSLSLFFVWAANAFVYYGLSVNSVAMSGDKYLNFALVCLIEIPGYTLSWYALNRFGRKKSLFSAMLLSALTCVGAAVVPADMAWAETTLLLVGKLGITSSFSTLYVYTAELYPTVMRSAGVGASSTIARAGAMVAPFAPLLGTYNHALPLLVFGIVALIASLLTLFYPETKGEKLPETTEEIMML